jgi:mannose-6-phosphate isomerase-like protein (cupin superfamily)
MFVVEVIVYMQAAMEKMQKRSLSQPEETRRFEKGIVELVNVGEVTFGRATLQPGWKWSTSVKPIVQTESCQSAHLQYHVSGRLHVAMDDGQDAEFGPGDVSVIPPGHDAWVVGNEPVVVVDISGLKDYAKG